MKIYFVRHGKPNYQDDCLTPLGHVQAKACAERLKDEGITKIYSSPMGRAQQTAGYLAELLGLPVDTLDYMHEITWGGRDGKELPMGGHPWAIGTKLIEQEDWNFKDDNWREYPDYKDNIFMDVHDWIVEEIDKLLLSYGFERRGTRYFCNFTTEETPAVFSHGGSSACAIAHMINLPLPYFASYFEYDVTSIIIVEFPDRPGTYVYPRIRLFNDIAHIKNLSSDKIEYKL